MIQRLKHQQQVNVPGFDTDQAEPLREQAVGDEHDPDDGPEILILQRPGVATGEQALVTEPIHTTVLIPAYNEEEALPHVLEAVLASVGMGYEVLVIDDGSSDDTVAVAERYPCRVISHDVNRGKGAAMKTGFMQARGNKVIVIDGDATYPADAIPEVSRQLDQHDVVRCVRSIGRDNMPTMNRLGNLIFDQLIKHVHQVQGSDMLSGLYGLQRRHLLAMRLESDGFDIESEILIKAQAMRLSAHTMPINYSERIGEKKLKPLRDGFKILTRIMSLALKYNPFTLYILPGLALWVLAFTGLAVLMRGPLITPLFGLSTHAVIMSTMAFLTGFQLIILGCIVNLYAAESGIRQPSPILSRVAAHFPRLWGVLVGLVMMIVGMLWGLAHVIQWLMNGLGAFSQTGTLTIALSLVIWGVQIISAMFFMSLFAGLARYAVAQQKELL